MNSSQLMQNPYQSPTPSAAATDKPLTPLLSSAAKMFLRHLVVVLGFTIVFLFVVPSFEKRFDAENWKLPAPTLLTMLISWRTISYWYLIVPLSVIYFCFLIGENAIERRLLGWVIAWPILFWLSVAFIAFVTCFGLMIPFIQHGTL